jgi:hypothetical protein
MNVEAKALRRRTNFCARAIKKPGMAPCRVWRFGVRGSPERHALKSGRWFVRKSDIAQSGRRSKGLPDNIQPSGSVSQICDGRENRENQSMSQRCNFAFTDSRLMLWAQSFGNSIDNQ